VITFVALYRKPADEAAFLKHYFDAHLPLARRIPGMTAMHVTRFTRNPMGGEPEYILMAEMQYPDMETYKAAMKSAENAEAGRDLMQFAAEVVTLLQGERVDVSDSAS